jgi:coproporphyrinogen III oxidase-like Fe-S oxidoreductase
LPDALREPIRRFPPGSLQFEVGIQTFNEEVAGIISRRQDNAKVEQNLRWLVAETGVHVHADLIVGLPGEDVTSFGRGFDRLVALRPQEIQVGMLKRLRGTPIVRHDQAWGMVYSPHAPYEVLQTKLIDFATMQRMRRFARYWDLVANSGNFIELTPLMWGDGSPFERFMELSDWLFERTGQTHAIGLQALVRMLFEYLVEKRGLDQERVAESLWRDYQRGGRSDRPAVLRRYVGPADTRRPRLPDEAVGLPRQRRRRQIAPESNDS